MISDKPVNPLAGELHALTKLQSTNQLKLCESIKAWALKLTVIWVHFHYNTKKLCCIRPFLYLDVCA